MVRIPDKYVNANRIFVMIFWEIGNEAFGNCKFWFLSQKRPKPANRNVTQLFNVFWEVRDVGIQKLVFSRGLEAMPTSSNPTWISVGWILEGVSTKVRQMPAILTVLANINFSAAVSSFTLWPLPCKMLCRTRHSFVVFSSFSRWVFRKIWVRSNGMRCNSRDDGRRLNLRSLWHDVL